MKTNIEQTLDHRKVLIAKKLNMKYIDGSTPTHQLMRLFTEKFPHARYQVLTRNGKIYYRVYAVPIPPTKKQLDNWMRFSREQSDKYKG